MNIYWEWLQLCSLIALWLSCVCCKLCQAHWAPSVPHCWAEGRGNLREWEGRVQLQAPLEFHVVVSRADTKREGRSLGEFRAGQEHSIHKGTAPAGLETEQGWTNRNQGWYNLPWAFAACFISYLISCFGRKWVPQTKVMLRCYRPDLQRGWWYSALADVTQS